MNLSYNNGKYDQVFALYEQYIQANPENQLARDLVTLVIASCYKLNTPESYERAKQFVGRTSGDEKFLSRKSIVMFSYLALLQGHLHESLEVLLMCNKSYYVARNIRILNLSRLGRFGEVMFELQSILSLVGEHKTGVLKEVVRLSRSVWFNKFCWFSILICISFPKLEQVRNEVERENNAAYTDQLEKLVKQLAQADCILDVTLDSCLNTPEPFVNRTEPNQRHSRPYHNQRYEPNQRYNRNSTYNNRAYNNRHSSMRNGLNEIEWMRSVRSFWLSPTPRLMICVDYCNRPK